MRLPKPIATGVRFQSRLLGSVYTAAQMKAYAVKAVEAEREACALLCMGFAFDSSRRVSPMDCAEAIRARGSK
jgi:hypothetical protein